MDEQEPVEQVAEEEELEDVYDAPGATRTSPYAIASIVVGFISLQRFPFTFVPTVLFRGGPANARDWFRFSLESGGEFIVAIVASVIAILLAGRAQTEIDLGEGAFGGKGLAVAAIWMGRSVLVMCASLFVLVLIAASIEPAGRPLFP